MNYLYTGFLQGAVRFSNNHGDTAKCVSTTKPKMISQTLHHLSKEELSFN